jgi:hypothetical protein
VGFPIRDAAALRALAAFRLSFPLARRAARGRRVIKALPSDKNVEPYVLADVNVGSLYGCYMRPLDFGQFSRRLRGGGAPGARS